MNKVFTDLVIFELLLFLASVTVSSFFELVNCYFILPKYRLKYFRKKMIDNFLFFLMIFLIIFMFTIILFIK